MIRRIQGKCHTLFLVNSRTARVDSSSDSSSCTRSDSVGFGARLKNPLNGSIVHVKSRKTYVMIAVFFFLRLLLGVIYI